jgi:heme/copper-type cytochrome/quinol oxidase subunit 4
MHAGLNSFVVSFILEVALTVCPDNVADFAWVQEIEDSP